jgi:hypothetical protein
MPAMSLLPTKKNQRRRKIGWKRRNQRREIV